MRANLLTLLSLTALCATACKSETAVEGANPGECADGADNDVDGFFDCDDNNCWSAPDCDEDNGNGNGNDTDPDTTDGGVDSDTDLPIDVEGSGFIDFLHSFAMTYRVSFEFDNLGQTICSTYFGIADCDCEALYSGRGVLISADGPSATYEGTWKLEGSSCFVLKDGSALTVDPTLNDGAIWRPEQLNGNFPGTEFHAFHTFQVKSSLKGIVDWVVHNDESMSRRMDKPLENEQFWLYATEAHTWDNTTWRLLYQESENKFIDLLAVRNVSKFEFQFSEGDTPPVIELTDIPEPPVDTDTDNGGIGLP